MIQIGDLHIREFRGIRDLDLKLGFKSFVVWGPNGSGKSGVVDAIDFALTGEISRLHGEGSGRLSVLKHGPHVESRDDPASATVTMTIRDTKSGKVAVLTRCIKSASIFKLEPDVAEVRAAVERAQSHNELTLSRREIIKFIIAEPGKRSQEVQALLKLKRVGEIRGLLKSMLTKLGTANKIAQAETNSAADSFRRHLDLAGLDREQVKSAINVPRATLGLPALQSISRATDIRQDVDTDTSLSTFNKNSAVRDVDALVALLNSPAEAVAAARDLNNALRTLGANPDALRAVSLGAFVATGIELVAEAQCPLCELDWPSVEDLRTSLIERRNSLSNTAELVGQISAALQRFTSASQRARSIADLIRPYIPSSGTEFATHLRTWTDGLIETEGSISTVAAAIGHGIISELNPLGVTAELTNGVTHLLKQLNARPDQSATALARTFLIVAQERLSRFRLARDNSDRKSTAYSIAKTIYETYCSTADEALTQLYDEVEAEFSAYYREINSDDESTFKAELESTSGALDLKVDFYGRGMFPPAAYHSEGHQDGMGVCLYLALINRLLGSDFRLAVLDDVVMSVDSNHRKQFCNLLKSHFGNVQFIITTHDEVWARQMRSSGLVESKAQARFFGWKIETGPTFEEGSDFWQKIETDINAGDVSAAAARLRRNLEQAMSELAESLQAPVSFRAHGGYDLGEFLGAVKGKHGRLLSVAAKSAAAWKNEDATKLVSKLKEDRESAILAQEGEQWAINPAVHFNDWATFSKADFLPVVEAWKQFLLLFTCTNSGCDSLIYVVRGASGEDALRCVCGTYNLNLRSK